MSLSTHCRSPQTQTKADKDSSSQVETRPSLRSQNSQGDIFSDQYDLKNHLYTNTAAGIALRFSPDWQIFLNTRDFPPKLREQAELLKRMDRDAGINGEMAMLGLVSQKMLQMRIIMEEVNLDTEEYFKIVHMANQNDLKDSKNEHSKLVSLAQKDFILWEYTLMIQDTPIRFVEYQFRYQDFNFRFTFWSYEYNMETVRADIRDIMTTLIILDAQGGS